MAAPTREDAFLMVELAKWGTALGLGDALPALMSESFDPDSADLSDVSVRTVLQFGESVASKIKIYSQNRPLQAGLMTDSGSRQVPRSPSTYQASAP